VTVVGYPGITAAISCNIHQTTIAPESTNSGCFDSKRIRASRVIPEHSVSAVFDNIDIIVVVNE
jgi:hypothetical protein